VEVLVGEPGQIVAGPVFSISMMRDTREPTVTEPKSVEGTTSDPLMPVAVSVVVESVMAALLDACLARMVMVAVRALVSGGVTLMPMEQRAPASSATFQNR
jgi:hypothetical protein